MAFYRCAGGINPTGDAAVGDVLAGKTFSNADGIDKTGTMTNRGAVTQSLNTSTTSYTIPAGYHNGSGKVSITTQEKTVTSSRSAQTVTPDSGKVLSKVTVNALAPTGTYTPTTRAANIDMGSTSNYRYVTTTSVPNTNSGTYTFAANDTGGTKDLGATNTYRYVNAANVYAKGKSDVLAIAKVNHAERTGENSDSYTGTYTTTKAYSLLFIGFVASREGSDGVGTSTVTVSSGTKVCENGYSLGGRYSDWRCRSNIYYAIYKNVPSGAVITVKTTSLTMLASFDVYGV